MNTVNKKLKTAADFLAEDYSDVLTAGSTVTLEMNMYNELSNDNFTYSQNIIDIIQNQFERIYQDQQMRKFLLKEISTHIKD